MERLSSPPDLVHQDKNGCPVFGQPKLQLYDDAPRETEAPLETVNQDNDKSSKLEQSIPQLQVDVEIEVPLAALEGKERETSDFVGDSLRELVGMFKTRRLDAYADAFDLERDYSKWGITIDPSIGTGQEPGDRPKFFVTLYRSRVADQSYLGSGLPIKIKAPPMTVAGGKHISQFGSMWCVIDPLCVRNIECWKMASTHIHVSMMGGPKLPMSPIDIVHISLMGAPKFPIELAQKLAFCIVYFEKAIDELMPKMTDIWDTKRPGGWRNCDRFAKRNRVRPKSNGRVPLESLRSCWESIRATRDMEQLHRMMCWDDDRIRRETQCEAKHWKWNFKGLDYTTIEFRQMPPARHSQETLDWIAFVNNFVLSVGKVDKDLLDSAADKKMSFKEALGLPACKMQDDKLHGGEWLLKAEARWAADRNIYPPEMGYLKGFVDCQDGAWNGILEARDRMERDLVQPLPN
ncbi:hypothetical protein F4678DRAFT_484428 [Xylaria arbuscula]|nr:hypothetical protein F4678DRAFT_484428 [Xylaria arbuscula]